MVKFCLLIASDTSVSIRRWLIEYDGNNHSMAAVVMCWTVHAWRFRGGTEHKAGPDA